MKKKYLLLGIMVFLFSAISIYLVLDNGKETYAVEEGGDVEENGPVAPSVGACYFNYSSQEFHWIPEGETISSDDYPYSDGGTITTQTQCEALSTNDFLTIIGSHWAKNKNGTFTYIDITASNVPVKKESGSTYRQYYKIKYYRNYNSNDNSTYEEYEGKKYYNEQYYITQSVPSRSTTYTFGGWYTTRQTGGIKYSAGATYTTNADLSLYARWTENISKYCDIYEITLTGISSLVVGKTGSVNAFVEGASNSYIKTYTWSSSNSNVLGVTGSGSTSTVLGKSVGTANAKLKITLTDGTVCSKTWTKSITVKNNNVNLGCDVAQFSISPSGTVEVPKGKNTTLTALVDGIDLDNVSSYTWSSSNSSIFTVNGNGSTATVKGVKEGTATLRMTPKIGSSTCDTITKTIKVTSSSSTTAPKCSDAYIDGYENYITVPYHHPYTLKSNKSGISFSNITWTIPSTLGFYNSTNQCKNKTECELQAISAGNNQTITVNATLTLNGKTVTCSGSNAITKTIKEVRPQASSGSTSIAPTCSNTEVKIYGPHSAVTQGITNHWSFQLKETDATTEPTITTDSWSISPIFDSDTQNTDNNGQFNFRAGLDSETAVRRTITGYYKVNGTKCSTPLTVEFNVKPSSGSSAPLTCDDVDVNLLSTANTVTVGTKVTYQAEYDPLNAAYISWNVRNQNSADIIDTTDNSLEITPATAGKRTIEFKYSVNGTECSAVTKVLTVSEATTTPVEENCDTTEVHISGPITVTVGDDVEYELLADNDGATLSNVTWDIPDIFTIMNGSASLLQKLRVTDEGEEEISATYSVNGHVCSEPATLLVSAYDEPTNPDEGVDNSQTGLTAVYIAFMLGLGMLGYSYYYMKKIKEN